jgi:uncharacterized protein YndB with AHSA1/START domain
LQAAGLGSTLAGMWFDVEAVPLSFTESSPFQFENTVLLDAPPARIFDIWATGEAQETWFQDFVANRWTTATRGVGAEREVKLKMLTVKERFLAWEPGKRITFHIYGITLPLVSAMVEDLQFEPVGDHATRMTWRAHYRPTLLMRMVHPIARMIFGELFKNSAEGLARYVKAHPAG